MKRRTVSALILPVILLAGPLATAAGQTQPPASETRAEVPELTAFHAVIYRIWHDAWPRKDVAALSAMLPEIEAGAAEVEEAALPGILRDKRPAWDAGVSELRRIVAEYADASSKNDGARILDAAEKLHSQFEALVRTIRPALREIDAFHQVLYPLYHYHLPAWDLPKIRAAVLDLAAKMEALDRAVLPERLEARRVEYEVRRDDLREAVGDLAGTAAGDADEKAIREAIENVHARYRALEGVF